MGLIILCLMVYIPGLWTIPPVDRDESRFAQASRQMLESGTLEGWVVPKVQDRPRLNKPPLIYWAQAGSAAILGDAPGQWAWLDGGSENIWVYRVPSVLSAIATVLLTWRLGVRMFDPRAGWLAAALLAVCPMVVWDAHQARADQLLLALTTATMFALWAVWSRRVHHGGTETRRRGLGGKGKDDSGVSPPSVTPCLRGDFGFGWTVAFWVFLALGIMTKGPITPMIAGLTCVALSVVSRDWRWLRRLRPALGVAIVFVVVSPWVYLVGHEVGWSKYLKIVYDETIGRSAGAKEGHWGPPGYHIVLLGVLFWPGSLLTAAAIGRAWRRGMRRKEIPSPSRDRKGASASERVCNGEPSIAPTSGGAGAGPGTTISGSAPQESARADRSITPDAPLRSRLVNAWKSLRDARPSRRAELFLLAWMLPSWVVFELVSTKLPHYTMPLYPAVALMSARALFGVRQMFLPVMNDDQHRRLRDFLASNDVRCPRCRYSLRGLMTASCPECHLDIRVRGRRLMVDPSYDLGLRVGTFFWFIFGFAIIVAVPLALAIANIDKIYTESAQLDWRPRLVLAGFATALVTLSLLATSVRCVRLNFHRMGTLCAVAGAVIALGITLGMLLPGTPSPWISKRVMHDLQRAGWSPEVPVATTSYAEDSLVFLTRGRLQKLEDEQRVRDWFETNRDNPIVLTISTYAGELTRSGPIRQDWWPKESHHFPVTGWDYSTGKRVSIYVSEYRR